MLSRSSHSDLRPPYGTGLRLFPDKQSGTDKSEDEKRRLLLRAAAFLLTRGSCSSQPSVPFVPVASQTYHDQLCWAACIAMLRSALRAHSHPGPGPVAVESAMAIAEADQHNPLIQIHPVSQVLVEGGLPLTCSGSTGCRRNLLAMMQRFGISWQHCVQAVTDADFMQLLTTAAPPFLVTFRRPSCNSTHAVLFADPVNGTPSQGVVCVSDPAFGDPYSLGFSNKDPVTSLAKLEFFYPKIRLCRVYHGFSATP